MDFAAEPEYWSVRPDKYFRNSRAAYRHDPTPPNQASELSASSQIAFYMAGHHRPTMDRVGELMRDVRDITALERSFFHELFAQTTPLECQEFMRSTSSTAREMAALMRAADVRRDIVVNWINQFANDPNWRVDGMLAIMWSDRREAARRRNGNPGILGVLRGPGR